MFSTSSGHVFLNLGNAQEKSAPGFLSVELFNLHQVLFKDNMSLHLERGAEFAAGDTEILEMREIRDCKLKYHRKTRAY
jgi:hypothetical protein